MSPPLLFCPHSLVTLRHSPQPRIPTHIKWGRKVPSSSLKRGQEFFPRSTCMYVPVCVHTGMAKRKEQKQHLTFTPSPFPQSNTPDSPFLFFPPASVVDIAARQLCGKSKCAGETPLLLLLLLLRPPYSFPACIIQVSIWNGDSPLSQKNA